MNPEQNPVLNRYAEDASAYKRQFHAREAHDRQMLHETFESDLCETLLTETSPDLEFDEYRPGNRQNEDLPAYFAEAARKSKYPEYLAPYSEEDFSGFQLCKVRGLDAGFAIKNGEDIVAVHNNSAQRGIAEKLLRRALEKGATKLDHFDGHLSKVYEKLLPEVYGVDKWNDEYAPGGWKFKPVPFEESHLSTIVTLSAEERREAEGNYAAGKPHVIYRRR